MSHTLARAFLDALPPGHPGREQDAAELGRQLQQLVQQARAKWPGVQLPDSIFARHLAWALSQPENQGQALDALVTDDLYLAAACGSGDQRGMTLCEQRFAGAIEGALKRQGVDPATQDDLRQGLREWLFVARPDRPPQILTYQGRGQLGGWLKVIVVRRALKSFRGKGRLRSLDQQPALVEQPEHLLGDDPEQQLSKLLFRSEFKEAFREATRSLATAERAILGRSLVDGASIDVIGQELGIHRSTAARRLDKAKRNLLFAMRRTIMQRHRLDEAGYDSALGLVRSQLDLSLRLLVATHSGPGSDGSEG